MPDYNFADQLLKRNAEYQRTFDKGDIPGKPSLEVAVVTCMDSRIDTTRVLGISEGQAHILRNAGGVVTDDTLRSLVISQHFLGTREIVLIHHTDCGMLTFKDEEFMEELQARVGHPPPFDFHAFENLETDVLESIQKVEACPFLLERNYVRGFVYDVKTGRLNEVRIDPT